jgi:hypothetical protein
MNILSWYGSIVRTEKATGRRIHAPLWPLRDVADDLELDLPSERIEGRLILPGDPPVAVQSAPAGRGVQLIQGDKFLSVQPGSGHVQFDRDRPRPSEIFMPFTAAQIARLRDIVGHTWRVLGTDEIVGPGDAWMADAFVLKFGSERIPVETDVPKLDASGDMLIALTAKQKTLYARRLASVPARDEIVLTRQAELPPPVQDADAFARAPEAALTLQGQTEFGYLPLTARQADQTWMHTRCWRPDAPTLGPYQGKTRVMRQRDKFVLMTDGQEGVIFDTSGVSNEAGYLYNQWVGMHALVMREGDSVLIDRAALDAAPRLAGCHAMFFNGNLSNYYHWVIDSLLPLFIMRPFLPAGTRLLIPGRIAALRSKPGIVDHMAALRAWGFGDMETVEITAPLCRVQDVVWLDHLSSINIVADMLVAVRAHVWALAGPRGAARRIYVRRHGSRSVLNTEELEAMLAPLGFETAEMEALSPAEQIAMFRDADYVVAGHGAALTNLIYCAPGTRVLELSPDQEYRSCYPELSDKLGLVHAVLPCPTDDEGFYGAMSVELAAFRRLLKQLQSWR